MGLGVDYSVHLYHNYRVERGKGFNPKEAMQFSIRDIGIAMLLATITTFIAFLSFLTAQMIPLRDFGVLCAIGIAYVFLITLTFQASMRFIIDRRRKYKKKSIVIEEKKVYGKRMRQIARIVCLHPLPIIILTCFISIIMAFGMVQIETGFAMEDFLPEENPSVKTLTTLIDEFPFASQEKEYLLIEGEDVATVSTLEGIRGTIDNLNDDDYVMMNRDGSPKTESILSVIKEAVLDNKSLYERFLIDSNGIPSSDSNVLSLFEYLYDHDSYNIEMQTFLHRNDNGEYDATVVHVYTNAFSNGDDVSNSMGELYDGLNADISDDFSDVNIIVTGENSMMHVIMNSMTESQLVSTAICLILASIVLIVAYRNPALGIITMIPVSISTLWIVGTMYFIGYSLNVMTIMITSLTIGLGITYAIHAVERFRLVAEHTGDVITAVSETIGHTGGALLISAVTTIIGFGMLVLTPMPVEQQFGIITALTILFAFLTSIFILPPVLLFWGRYRKKHKGYIISPGDPDQGNK
jgi:predicted RND superfamily exporter protein